MITIQIDENIIEEVAKKHAPYWKSHCPSPHDFNIEDEEFKVWHEHECEDCVLETLRAQAEDEKLFGSLDRDSLGKVFKVVFTPLLTRFSVEMNKVVKVGA